MRQRLAHIKASGGKDSARLSNVRTWIDGSADHHRLLDTIQPGIMGSLYLGSLLPTSGINAAGYDTLGSLDTNTPFIVRKLTVESRNVSQPPTVDLKSFW
jgi:hypothetical protein